MNRQANTGPIVRLDNRPKALQTGTGIRACHASNTPNGLNAPSGTGRLKFLDGMRGLAALYIVLYHATGDDPPPAAPLRSIAWFLQFGHYAVGVFIVLSGFCLMMPVAKSLDGHLRGGLRGYLKRRIRRIFPAYYVVLALTATGVAFVQSQHPILSGEEADVINLSPAIFISHLLMAHNLHPIWAQTLDPPMWTVALECQIYLLFPLLLLPIWRRFGTFSVVCFGFAIGIAPHLLLPSRFNLDWTFPWFIGLFCLGMAGASLNYSHLQAGQHWRPRFPWGAAGLSALLLFAFIAGLHPDMPVGRMWLPDSILGLAMMCLIVEMERSDIVEPVPAAPRADRPANERSHADLTSRKVALGQPFFRILAPCLECPSLVLIGMFSYSLYLLHAPILWGLFPFIHALQLSGNASFLFRLLVGVPLCLAISYGFYWLVERPFLAQN